MLKAGHKLICSSYNFWTETVAEGKDTLFSIYINLMQSNYMGVYVRFAKLVYNFNQCKMLQVVLGSRYKGFLQSLVMALEDLPSYGRLLNLKMTIVN